MRRPTAGDRVKILTDTFGTQGRVCVIDKDDHTVVPYRIDGLWYWESDVELVEESPQSAERELNVGDKVRVKSLEWYKANKDSDGHVLIKTQRGLLIFTKLMAGLCGEVVTISKKTPTPYGYEIAESPHSWAPEFFEPGEPRREISFSIPVPYIMESLTNGFIRLKKPSVKGSLPLIKTNKLLTNIKLD